MLPRSPLNLYRLPSLLPFVPFQKPFFPTEPRSCPYLFLRLRESSAHNSQTLNHMEGNSQSTCGYLDSTSRILNSARRSCTPALRQRRTSLSARALLRRRSRSSSNFLGIGLHSQ